MSQLPNQESALELDQVAAEYSRGAPVIQDYSLRIGIGEIVLMRGPNGAGKSTILELASGYLRPTHGTVRVSGVAARSRSAQPYRRICRSAPAFYPSMTLHDHLIIAARISGSDRELAFERAARFGLEPWFTASAKELSTGNAQKAWLIMMTLGTAPLFVLDEPFRGLDALGTSELISDIHAWSLRSAVLLITHDRFPTLRISRTELLTPHKAQ
ncbi:ATP-binding cassette domain-containing protein [Mycetocola sp. JXN-3]|uniref:ABC transporter ATP-binding protein n=1 Tax=Mycetocola sp. JXN-3 TaxID=2116510 RepID=UPI00165D2CCB|nr:ATP-binding cassette domain-containing protein [Mycetocola sp. JXN-3]